MIACGPQQITIGLSQRDSNALDRTVAAALELFAAGIWDGRGQLVVNFPHSLHHRLHRLRRDPDFAPLSASQCRQMGIGEECALSSKCDE